MLSVLVFHSCWIIYEKLCELGHIEKSSIYNQYTVVCCFVRCASDINPHNPIKYEEYFLLVCTVQWPSLQIVNFIWSFKSSLSKLSLSKLISHHKCLADAFYFWVINHGAKMWGETDKYISNTINPFLLDVSRWYCIDGWLTVALLMSDACTNGSCTLDQKLLLVSDIVFFSFTLWDLKLHRSQWIDAKIVISVSVKASEYCSCLQAM